MRTVSTAKELGQAVSRGESRIVVTGHLGDAVIVIEATGPVAWGVAIGAITVSVVGVVMTVGTGGAAAPAGAAVECIAAPAAIAALGSTGAAVTATQIALACGGVGVLHTLRRYKATREGGSVVLTKRL